MHITHSPLEIQMTDREPVLIAAQDLLKVAEKLDAAVRIDMVLNPDMPESTSMLMNMLNDAYTRLARLYVKSVMDQIDEHDAVLEILRNAQGK